MIDLPNPYQPPEASLLDPVERPQFSLSKTLGATMAVVLGCLHVLFVGLLTVGMTWAIREFGWREVIFTPRGYAQIAMISASPLYIPSYQSLRRGEGPLGLILLVVAVGIVAAALTLVW